MIARPCLDCGVPTDAGSRCAECAPTGRAPDARVGRQRPSRPHAWRRLSKRARRAQPWCSIPGCTSTDLTTDHVVAVDNGGPMVPGPEGVAVLCRSHNSRKGTRDADQPDPGEGPPTPKGAHTRGLAREPIELLWGVP